MSEFTFAVEGGQSVRLKTAGKYCDRDILVTAKAGDTEAIYEQGVADGKQFYMNGCEQICFSNLNLLGVEHLEINSPTIKDLSYFHQADVENTTVKHITITTPMQIYSLRAFCSGLTMYDKCLEQITLNCDTSACTWWLDVFVRMYALKIIDGTPLNPSSCNGNGISGFNTMNDLKHIRFAENSIKHNISLHSSAALSAESIQSIIYGLSDTATNKTATFNQAAVNAAFTTDDWNALVATKPNWTITLV